MKRCLNKYTQISAEISDLQRHLYQIGNVPYNYIKLRAILYPYSRGTMSLEVLQDVLSKIPNFNAVSIQLIQYTSSKANGIACTTLEVEIADEHIKKLVTDISQNYANLKSSFTQILSYDGGGVSSIVYYIDQTHKLRTKDENFRNKVDKLLGALSDPDTEGDPLAFEARAYGIKLWIDFGDCREELLLISIQSPFVSLKHKFLRADNKFEPIENKVLSFKKTIDILYFRDCFYFFSSKPEGFFDLERSYKRLCKDSLKDIQQCDLIEDFSRFERVASSGHNPRKFLSFRQTELKLLESNVNLRQELSHKFNIPLSQSLKFKITDDGEAERLIKLLCGKGMSDPFNNQPFEVINATKWK